MGDTPEYEPCEMCGKSVTYGYSLCHGCDDMVAQFDEVTGLYILNNGEVVDTTKHQSELG